MSWRVITEADLSTVLDSEELALYRERATTDAGVDPVPALILNAVEEARDRIRANERNRLALGATVPVGMIARCLVVIRQRVLTICKINIGEDRRKEYEAAETFFRDVAAGKVSVPLPEDAALDVTPERAKPKYQSPSRGNSYGI